MNDSAASDPLPAAALRPRRRWTWSYVWLLPVLAVLFASWLMVDAWQQRGTAITLRFQQGHGLKAGAALRYRGIDAGRVERVTLTDDLGGISVQVRLAPSAVDLARAGSRFWIVRPQLDLSGVSGLETVVGANYLSVLPGQLRSNELQREFVGLEQAPLAEVMEPGGLEIVLTAPGRGNLRPGAPVSYRQVVIGTVVSVDLAKDASAVEASVYIKPDYLNLIRENVKFWRASGAQLKAGLGGLSVALDSVPSMVLGGINLAIPSQPGKRLAPASRLPLYDQPEDSWLEWVPGVALYSEPAQQPRLLPASLRWQQRNWLYLKRSRERRAWVLPQLGGLLGPADVLLAPADALANSVQLILADTPLDLAKPAQPHGQGLALLPLAHDYPVWPAARQRTMSAAENSLLIAGPEQPARFVAAEHWRQVDGGWTIGRELSLDAQWHGAAVVAERDGALLGLLLVEEGAVKLAPLPGASQ